MKNLESVELKASFKANIIEAISKKNNEALTIIFKFGDTSSYKFDNEEISLFGGRLYYKEISFPYNMQSIEIIVENMCYSCFALIEKEYKHGESECHGHGEYWGTDIFTFRYFRFKEAL